MQTLQALLKQERGCQLVGRLAGAGSPPKVLRRCPMGSSTLWGSDIQLLLWLAAEFPLTIFLIHIDDSFQS
jgi:hypothetical protein